ncbi:MAG: PilT/PilU family type 4a pilus ATPase [Candidatus Omnitrophica bacterium]|nr:PilT/PilU family type 4a pilus ATPase [Candidatus Omnitrophota bacterium]
MSDAKKLLTQCLTRLHEIKGQDLFLKVDTCPRIRVGRHVQSTPFSGITEEDIQAVANLVLTPAQKELLEKNRSVDLAFSLEGSRRRYRANAFYQQGQISFVIRTLWENIPSLKELQVPPILEQVALSRSGIILIAGVVASGKTTTINAIIEMMNQNMERHIITIEDPLEYLHHDNKCIINQREIGQDANDFNSALKYVVRQSPDVVVIGEMRDAETFNFALSAAEVGRLVIATVHAKTVVQIFDRVLGFFPVDQQDTILAHLYPNITCFAVQQLLVGADGASLVPAFEIMVGNYTTRQLVKERKFEKIPQTLRNSAQEGMMTMDQSIHDLWRKNLITQEVALASAERPQELGNAMKGIAIDGQTSKILGS